jgi:hypothetical protein
MIRIHSEQELREAFRPLDREELALPQDLEFPFVVKDYFAWTEPSGFRIYLVLADRLKRLPMGIVFRRDQSGGDTPRMCEWCHSVRGGNAVTLLTAAASEKRRVGLHLCGDLSCKDRVDAAPGPDDVPQVLSGVARLRRITERMGDFARRTCF